MADRRLHIVAAPGAGKTSLGLEVFRRLGRPALVLTPTLTIRDQWIGRLDDFMDGRPGPPEWCSTELQSPAFFTAATYQAVLMRSRADATREGSADSVDGTGSEASVAPTREDEATLTELMRSAGVGTLILDEAHHLKRAWWRSLERVVSEVPGLQLVSLTGTPPYDATGHEWRRYEELCGSIDEEITAPELVKARTLCPHQDFVFAVAPTPDEAERVLGHDAAVRETLAGLLDDADFQAAVDGHPWLGPEPPIEEIIEEPELAFALLSYAQTTGDGATGPLELALDVSGESAPALDVEAWETLLRARLYDRTFRDDDARRDLASRLRSEGLLWRRTLRLARSPDADRALSMSKAKLRACVDINVAERAVRRDSLRQVLLFDFIRDEGLLDPPGSATAELGAFPVFDALKRDDVALLTGRVTAIHESRLEALSGRIPPTAFTPLPHRPGWLRVQGVRTGLVVSELTRLLGDGHIRVIVGTRSLLGEGWDAPVVNSVVLGSYVGAFVSTNQMRGRAIRADPDSRTKVASVWHLVAVKHGTPTGSRDFDQLRRRFRTFVGLSADGNSIESGLERLDPPRLDGPGDLNEFNEVFIRRLGRLPQVAVAWHEAIDRSELGQVVPTVSFRSPPSMRPLLVTRTLRALLVELGWASAFAVGSALRAVATGVGTAVMIGAAIPFVLLLPKTVRAGRLAILHAPIDGSLRQIAQAVVEALADAQLLDDRFLEIHVEREPDGSVLISAHGGTFYDQSVFADAIGEVFGPVANPRYLITRPSRGLGRSRPDYHAVPSVFGAKRELADAFHRAWLRHVGAGQLIYTRRDGGRRLLLAARARAFANQFEDPAERLDRWR